MPRSRVLGLRSRWGEEIRLGSRQPAAFCKEKGHEGKEAGPWIRAWRAGRWWPARTSVLAGAVCQRSRRSALAECFEIYRWGDDSLIPGVQGWQLE